jgi:hypothetical protein
MLYVKLIKVFVGDMTKDRVIEQDIVLRCVDEDHQFHLFREVVASFDNNPDWRHQTVSDGFREYLYRESPKEGQEFMAVISGNDDNPHWEPEAA